MASAVLRDEQGAARGIYLMTQAMYDTAKAASLTKDVATDPVLAAFAALSDAALGVEALDPEIRRRLAAPEQP